MSASEVMSAPLMSRGQSPGHVYFRRRRVTGQPAGGRPYEPCLGDCPRDMRLSGAAERADCGVSSAPIRSADGTTAALRPSRGRCVPRHGAGCRGDGHLPATTRSHAIRLAPAARGEALAVASPRVVPDDEPLPPGRPRRARAPLTRDAPPELSLRAARSTSVTTVAVTSSRTASTPKSCETTSTSSTRASTSSTTPSAPDSAPRGTIGRGSAARLSTT